MLGSPLPYLKGMKDNDGPTFWLLLYYTWALEYHTLILFFLKEPL